MKQRIIVRVTDAEKARIAQRIKQDYPKLRNVSEVLRAALTNFLGDAPATSDPAKILTKGEKPCKTSSLE